MQQIVITRGDDGLYKVAIMGEGRTEKTYYGGLLYIVPIVLMWMVRL